MAWRLKPLRSRHVAALLSLGGKVDQDQIQLRVGKKVAARHRCDRLSSPKKRAGLRLELHCLSHQLLLLCIDKDIGRRPKVDIEVQHPWRRIHELNECPTSEPAHCELFISQSFSVLQTDIRAQ